MATTSSSLEHPGHSAISLSVIPGVKVVGAAADGEQAVALVARHRPQVVLMDLRMPRLDGVEATRRILADYPATAVVVLTTERFP